MKKLLQSFFLILFIFLIGSNSSYAQWTNGQAAAVVYGQDNFTSHTEGSASNNYLVRPVSVAFTKNNRKVIIAQVTVSASTSHLYVYNDYNDALNANTNISEKILLPNSAIVNSVFVDENDNLWVGIVRSPFNSAYNLFKYENASSLTSSSLPVAKFKLSRYDPIGEDKSSYKPSIFVKSGSLFVADAVNYVVARYDLSDFGNAGGEKYPVAYLGTLGAPGTNLGASIRFWSPSQLTVDKDNALWIADNGNSRVLKFSDAFNFNSSSLPNLVLGRDSYNGTSNSNNNNGLASLNGIASDNNGRIYIASTNSQFLNGFSKYGTKILIYNANLFTNTSNNTNVNPVNIIGYANASASGGVHETGGYSAEKIFNASNIAVKEHLFVTDYTWNRVTRFDPSTTLPVTLTSLNASNVNGKVNLSWKTSAEVNNSHYIVSTSYDGKNFKQVETVKAKNAAGEYSVAIPIDLALYAGFGLLGLLMLPRQRNKWLNKTVLILSIALLAACAKEGVNKADIEIGGNSKQTLYIKLEQVDLDGKVTELGVKSVSLTLSK